MIEYDNKRNEVTIRNCEDCPFEKSILIFSSNCSNHSHPSLKIEYYCKLTDIKIEEFPQPSTDCPLRDPNFKLTRIF